MTGKELKARIREEFAKETPNIKSEIEISCKNEIQESAPVFEQRSTSPIIFFRSSPAFRKAVACAVCLLIFISGAAFGFLVPKGAKETVADTFVYLDVNPSIEMQFDADGRVVACIAGNDDAEGILNSLDLVGVEMNTAMAAVVGSMYVNGYITASNNSILISVDGKDEEKTASLLSSISDKVAGVFEKSDIDCSIIAQSIDVKDELLERAEELGISVGKLRLMEKMTEGIGSLGEESISELSRLSISELNLIYTTRGSHSTDVFDKDIVTGTVGGFIKADEALDSLLAAINLQSELLSGYDAYAAYETANGQPRLVYCVSISLRGDIASYHFKVDCESGEVVEFDLNIGLP